MNHLLNIGGIFNAICLDRFGQVKWTDIAKNAFTDEGLNHVLDVLAHGATQTNPWYIGLIGSTAYSALAAGDTLASHAGWTEEIPTSAALRLEWTEGAASSKSMTNSATVDFAINASKTIKGAHLASAASGTSGILLCTGLFTEGDRAVVSGDTLKITYTLTAAAA